MIFVLLVGPHISCKGGITSVLKNYLCFKNNLSFKFILHSVRRDGNKLSKFLYIFPSIITYIFKLLFSKIHVIHIHPSEEFGFYRYIPFIILGKFFKKKILLHMHGCKFDEFYLQLNAFKKIIVHITMNSANGIICLSKSWEKVYKKITHSKTYTIHNTVPQPTNNPYNISSQTITFMGFIGPRKGIFDLLKVIKNLNQFYNFKLEICGSGQVEKLIRKLKEYHIDKITKFHGWINEKTKDEILRRTSIFVLPSYNEGLPMVLLEAMSYGIPVISTNVGGIPELVEKENGFLVEPGNLNCLGEKLEILLNQPQLRRQMSKSNFYKIQSKFSMNDTFNKLSAIYNEIYNKVE